MFKKMIATALISSVLLSGLAISPAWAKGDVPITVNGKKIVNDAVVALTYGPDGNPNGQVVLWPLRKVAEALKYTVTWDGKQASVSSDTKKIGVGPTDNVVIVYGKQNASTGELDVANQMIDGHIFIEVDFFTKYLGAKLSEQE